MSTPADIVVRTAPRAYAASFDTLRADVIAGVSRTGGLGGSTA
jgi:hypothetical protein